MRLNSRGFSLIELLVVIAIIALLVAILIPTVRSAKSIAYATKCSSRMKHLKSAFSSYGVDYNGIYIAPWERQIRLPGGGWDASDWSRQWQYIISYWASGNPIPLGTPPYEGPVGGGAYVDEGWWQGSGQPRDAHPYRGYDKVPSMHCPALNSKALADEEVDAGGGASRVFALDWTTFSYGITGRWWNVWQGKWNSNKPYNIYGYPNAARMTHPATTVLVQDRGGCSAPSEFRNIWSDYDGLLAGKNSNPHLKKSDYPFWDGHVERLSDGEVEQDWFDGER